MAKRLPLKMKKKARPFQTTAFHGQTENGVDVVMIDKLRVALTQDGNMWVAQGLEIDYAAEGASIEDVKSHFERGLLLTLRENIRVFGNIKNVLRVVPPDVWNALMADNVLREVHSQFSAHRVRQLWKTVSEPAEVGPNPPVGMIDYYLRQRSALGA
jgi:hypothetical protein